MSSKKILYITFLSLILGVNAIATTPQNTDDINDELTKNLIDVAYNYRLKGRFKDAQTVLKNGIEILSLQTKSDLRVADLKIELARVITRENFHNYTKEKNIEALALYQEVETTAQKEKSKRLLGAALYGFGQYHFFLGYDADGGTENWDVALTHLEKSLVICRQIDDSIGTAKALFLIGTIYQRRKELEKADEKYLESLKLAKKAKSVYMEAENERHIGFQYYFRGDKEKALEYLLKSLEKRRSIGYDDGVIFGLTVVSEIYEELGKLDMAEQYLHEALPFAQTMDSKVGLSRIYDALGRVYYAQKKNDKALVSLKKAKDIAGSIGYEGIEKSSQELLDKIQMK